MPKAKDLKELENLIKAKISKSLQTSVAQVGRETMKEKIEDVVYAVYEPVLYERQKDDGGLTDDENILTTMVNDTTLSIESHRMDGDKNVSEVIVSGDGYDFEFPYYGRPRDFVEATKEELADTRGHVAALYVGLKKQGLDVKVK
ncbi:hypothetical protein [Paenibacillus sp. XY044]|uniref:hypothetical protein n=1 Tax=Paenibacillus sp. XY044 TaxID=2026089 RepID=UPI000B98BCC0|nr:hypothetical protein [Paenibacillus sp. XY044]OZB98019.1 hypothetical protein CJP46_02310 [Paenibacillus sp. XY044]